MTNSLYLEYDLIDNFRQFCNNLLVSKIIDIIEILHQTAVNKY